MRMNHHPHVGPERARFLTILAVLVCLALLAVTAGCAPTAQLHGTAPARVGLPGVQTLTVDHFPGPYGEQVRQCLLHELLSGDRYTVLEGSGPAQAVLRAEVVPWLEDRQSTGAATVTDRMERTVTITRDDGTEVTRQETVRVERTVFVPQVQRSAEVTARLTVVDPRTGGVLAATAETQCFEDSYGGPESLPEAKEYDADSTALEDMPSQRFILSELGCDVGRELGRALMPQAYVRSAELDVGQGDGPVEEGAWLADQGDWEAAARVWRSVLDRDPDNPAAAYNLGLYWEARGTVDDFLLARDFYRQAMAMEPKMLYRTALERIDQRLDEAGRLAEQKGQPAGQP